MPDENGAYSLRLPAFEGPLDLLLHLIRINQLDIYDIPIVEITRQYDEYLMLMRELNLHVAGEYLLMASTLLHIKSKMLLPEPPAGVEPEEDPRSDLIRQLVEHERFRAAAENLRMLAEAREDYFLRPGDPLEPYEGESLLSVSIFDLVTALKGALERLDGARAVEIGREEFSVDEKAAWIVAALADGRARRFQDLMGTLRSRAEKIVAFLALLELVRLGHLLAAQRTPGGDVLVLLRTGPAPVSLAPVEMTGGPEGGHA